MTSAFMLAAVAVSVLPASCGKGGGGPSTTPATRPTSPQSSLPAGRNDTGMPLNVPAGFEMSIFSSNLKGPRVLIFDSSGTLLVSDMDSGRVVALPDKDNNGAADSQVPVASGLNNPHGLAFTPGNPRQLYVAETDQVAIFDYDPATMTAANKRKIIDLPPSGGHITRTIMFAPPPFEGQLLIAVGSSMNVGYETDPQRAKILIANADGSGLRPFASGLRNSVFMTVHPTTGQVWATENGRDYLGDNLPPDEVNIIQDGQDYGWPTCYGNNIHDTQFDKNQYVRDPCAGKTPAHVDLQAHSAPLGLAFVTSDRWPSGYKYNLLVSFHGSWNRSSPTGYKVVRVKLDSKGTFQGVEDFITGWLGSNNAISGRPVGILMRDDGTCFISDDDSGNVYRLRPQ